MKRREFITLLGGAAGHDAHGWGCVNSALRCVKHLTHWHGTTAPASHMLAASGLQAADDVATRLPLPGWPRMRWQHRSRCARRLGTLLVMCLGLSIFLSAAFAQDKPTLGAQSSGLSVNKPAHFQIQSVSPSFGVELRPVDLRGAAEIERALATFAGSANGGLILTGSALAIVHRDLIIALAARNRLPAVYYERYFAAAGGLVSYGTDTTEQFRLAAGYVDRILKGEKPADLPVQAPTELVINLKTAKGMGLTVPETPLARAEEVIE